MKNKVNFLVTTLDDQDEAKQQRNMNGLDNIDKGGNYFERGLDNQKQKEDDKKCLENIIIYPDKNAWLDVWNYIINFILLYGYIMDPYHVAFYLASGHVKSADVDFNAMA